MSPEPCNIEIKICPPLLEKENRLFEVALEIDKILRKGIYLAAVRKSLPPEVFVPEGVIFDTFSEEEGLCVSVISGMEGKQRKELYALGDLDLAVFYEARRKIEGDYVVDWGGGAGSMIYSRADSVCLGANGNLEFLNIEGGTIKGPAIITGTVETIIREYPDKTKQLQLATTILEGLQRAGGRRNRVK